MSLFIYLAFPDKNNNITEYLNNDDRENNSTWKTSATYTCYNGAIDVRFVVFWCPGKSARRQQLLFFLFIETRILLNVLQAAIV